MLRVALAQINPTVGNIAGNAGLIGHCLTRAAGAGAGLVVFPELALTGYPPEDLLFKPAFIAANLAAVERIAAGVSGLVALVGFVDRREGRLYNACAVLAGGRVRAVYHKRFLPNYSVFDEERYFKAGRENFLFLAGKHAFSVSICEDIWHAPGPVAEQAAAGSRLAVNISASPYQRGKFDRKAGMLAERASKAGVFLCYANLAGGQDELVFDGRSMVFDPRGRLIARARAFAEDLLVVDLDLAPGRAAGRNGRARAAETRVRSVRLPAPGEPPARAVKPRLEETPGEPGEIYRALVLGTRDYVVKNGFADALIGLSGGIDSALTAAIAVDALGAARVSGVFMPGPYSSAISAADSRRLAENLGIACRTIDIGRIFDAYRETMRDALSGGGAETTEENIQARIRGNILMALSNCFGSLVLTTGNKSELATGYCTLYGDMAGGFAVIKDIPKTLVYRLAAYRNQPGPVIPRRTIRRAPTAELKPNQRDSDRLPPYEVLDPIMHAYIEENLAPADIARLGFPAETVRRVVELIDRNEYKRRQAAPGVKITARAFGKDWRLPITNAFRPCR